MSTITGNDPASKRLDYAQWFARKGITVFIVEPNSKRPLGGRSWYLRQTTDPEQVAEWFDHTPGCNYGLHLGSQYVAIDLDLKPGIDGIAEFEAICKANGVDDFRLDIPTLQVRTPGGGYHLIFKVPFPVANKNTFPKGIDVRGAVGYIVGAGSRDSRGEWAIVKKVKIANIPEWLLPFLREPGQRDPNAAVPLVELDLPENIAQAIEWLTTAQPATEGDEGDNHTYEICCKLRDFGLSEGAALEALEESGWNSRCDPPWENDHLEKKIENSYSYGQNRPGCAAESLQLARIIACRPDDNYGLTDERIYEMFHPLPPRLIVDNTRSPVDADIPDVEAAPKADEADEDYYFPAYMESELDQIPDPDFLIDQNVGESSTHMVFGPSGALKTFYVLDQALHGVTNRVWAAIDNAFPGFKIKRPLKVAMIVGEGARGMKRRIRAWKIRHGVTKDLMFLVLPIMPVFNLPSERAKLVRTIKHHLGTCDLVIVDTAMRAASGLNLMDPTGARDFLDTLDAVSAALDGCAVTFVHHTGKDIGRGALGADYLKAHVDYVDFIECIHEASGVRIIQVENHKSKDGEKRADMWFKATTEDIPSKVGVPGKSLVLERHSKVPSKAYVTGTVGKADRKAEVRAALAALGADKKQIINAVLANKIIQTQLDDNPALKAATETHDQDRMENSERTLLRRHARSGLLAEFVAGSAEVSNIAWLLPTSKPTGDAGE